MENTSDAKQQIVEKVNNAKHILVTVPKNPSVDELSAAVGLSLLLDELDKRPNIIFSGKIPPAISFLEPKKLITQNIDGLRDFIVALSKDKADKLRWKVEDDIVKIFITPYKTTLSEKDLNFSQGEFNIEVVIALGVEKSEDLDKALQAQGKILHDASVVTINTGNKTSSLGSIDWQDKTASSICEMLVGISESFGNGLLDEQISTALLTGIVANTNRFSNELTTPKVMTMSAQLMSSGANQQLITSHLSEPQDLEEDSSANVKDAKNMPKDEKKDEGSKNEVNLNHKPAQKEARLPKPAFKPMPKEQNKPDEAKPVVQPPKTSQEPTQEEPQAQDTPEDSDKLGEAKASSFDDEKVPENYSLSETEPISPLSDNRHKTQIAEPPKFGGALNSLNTEKKEEASVDGLANQSNKPVSLTHSGSQMPPEPQPLAVPEPLQPPEPSITPDILDSNSTAQTNDTPKDDASAYLEQARQAVADASGDAAQPLPEPAANPSNETPQSDTNVPTPMTNPDWDSSVNGPEANDAQSTSSETTADTANSAPAQQAQPTQPPQASTNPTMPPPLPPLPTDPNASLPPLPNLQNPVAQPQQQAQPAQPLEQPQIVQNPAPTQPSDPGTFPLPPMQ